MTNQFGLDLSCVRRYSQPLAIVKMLSQAITAIACIVCTQWLTAPAAWAQTTVPIAQIPLLALKSAPGLVMLTMSRDHRLFYAAYNETSDIDGDGVVDVGFKPNIVYYGNFVSDRCYDYITTGTNSPLYRPVAILQPINTVAPSGCNTGVVQRWSGNWLNWAATSRMDTLRRVLYGGYRVVDNATTSGSPSHTSTVLQGAYIPNDSHVWGKEFRPVTRDSYKITDYTPLATPAAGKQHLFVVVSPTANTGYPFLSGTVAPVLRYITNADQTTERIWYWASADVAQGIGRNPANFGKGGGRTSVAATDRTLRVEACVPIPAPSGAREAGCLGYPTGTPITWKPTGVLHDYSLTDSLKFGLLTGSYQNNYSGGVVRRNVRSFKDEIAAANGTFSDVSGIARTIDRITIHGWGGSQYDCGYKTTANRDQGACKSWGAPIGEMMYEGLRYFSGKASATSAFDSGVSTGAESVMGFTALPAWKNPYVSKTSDPIYGNPICSKPVQMVIADPLTSFDSDQLPGAYFTPTANFGTALGPNDLAGLNVSTEADKIWGYEALGSRNVYIGQSGLVSDGNPTAKAASNFSQLRGHAPDETQSQGGFYSAGVARFARNTGVPIGAPTGVPAVPTVPNQTVDTVVVALGSLTPRIEFPNPIGGKVTIIPLSKAIYSANKNPGQYQATGAITGFYYANYTPTSVSAVVNFSDSDQGTDNETDAQVRYDINLVGTTLTIQMTQLDPNPGGIQSNLGYVISGTSKDGLYLDTRTNTGGTPLVYYLDTSTLTTPPQSPKTIASPLNGTPPGNSNGALPTFGTTTSRVFTLSATPSVSGSFIPHDPLWYAAKYGGTGAKDAGNNPVSAVDANGDPVNYFRVTSPANLPAQLGKAFRAAASLAAVSNASVVGAGQRSQGSAALYQAIYESSTWSSKLSGFLLDRNGVGATAPLWEVSALIPTPSLRTNLFLGRGGNTSPTQLVSGGYLSNLNAAEQVDFGDAVVYEYLLGDKSQEERKGGKLRNRGGAAAADVGSVLGDIVNSDPQIIGLKDYGYTASDPTYTTFLATLVPAVTSPVTPPTESLAVGTNNGFFQIFDASPTTSGGRELLGFMPQAARTNVKDLASPGYSHRYFVDGSIGLGHAKIAVPGNAVVSWRSVAVAAGGAGAKTVFAVNTTSQTYSANSILWEINENTALPADTAGFSSIGRLGNVMGRPTIGKLSNGVWVALFGNGYNSVDLTANLIVARLDTGVILAVIPTRSSISNNGLGSTEIVKKSTGNKDTIEFVYGADYKGNIWRFNLSTVTASNTGWPSSGALVYSTPTGRPITAEIKVAPATGSPSLVGSNMIYFGTGSFLNSTDVTTVSPSQALYGIYDDLIWTLNTSAAVAESSLVNMTISMATPASDTRSTSSPATPWYSQSGKKGWVLPLTGTNVAAGERVIAPPLRYTVPGIVDAYFFTSTVPGTDECRAGVDVWITGVDAMTGGFAGVFDGSSVNSIKIVGGSPRGAFILDEGNDPSIYIGRSILDGVTPSTSFSSTISGAQPGSDILGIKITKKCVGAACSPLARSPNSYQSWRQLK